MSETESGLDTARTGRWMLLGYGYAYARSRIMTVYRGVVRGKMVELTEATDLPDGTEVEVRAVSPNEESPASPRDIDERAREETFLQHLLEIGLISRIPSRRPPPGWKEPEPIEIEGPPLSEQIIEERR